MSKTNPKYEKYILRLADLLGQADAEVRNLVRRTEKLLRESVNPEKVVRDFELQLMMLITEATRRASVIAEEKNDSVMPLAALAIYMAGTSYGKTLAQRIAEYARQLSFEVRGAAGGQTLAQARSLAGLRPVSNRAVNNILRLQSDFIVRGYNYVDRYLMIGNGAIGYVGFRCSTFDCPLCDSLCGVFHPITEVVFPAHVRCVCGMAPVFLNDLL